MATFSQLPSGKWRVQVRKAGIYKAATFATKREARERATTIEAHANHVAAGSYAPVPKSTMVADLIDKYTETFSREPGRTKASTVSQQMTSWRVCISIGTTTRAKKYP